MKQFKRPEHRIIAEALALMDHEFLTANRCWFGGGTAIVMKFGEYRRSLDVDFLCADADGYRELRTRAAERGARAFFPEPVEAVRDFQIDQYGLRTVVRLKGQLIKFEIIREGRIQLQGHFDDDLNVPALIAADMFAEKLLANADRCQDHATAYRDAIDLGTLVNALGEIPAEALSKAQTAYGSDIQHKIAWVVNKLQDRDELRSAAESLQMDTNAADAAISVLRNEGIRLWPGSGIRNDPADRANK
ncbi:nucleotidyl transferase AbiEii/AbiGii toxin family protein [Mesorhizobium muleiense]|uniref:Nucleotidyl transferase AbiEii toxin, Type IV TA system n=1 Tax=Mesorhizobium muleiense TaxID=1004279 RepID=A0A1G8J4U9_9HYPH|nr:nucleotidyl transferase AbiEii/AbiGii toxin family protein [Mesorhizobium muleiense]MCF6099879.1 nucleotidyl transferase AbiEii/AbiGii toxin family protein [Mesorhizobium muleiense]SDI26007.1 Nucleotidyl transferase AbiEii toxin, Type IV TA system [Mesorhizobium muleiense]